MESVFDIALTPVYALISPELDVKAIHAAPFKNSRSKGHLDVQAHEKAIP